MRVHDYLDYYALQCPRGEFAADEDRRITYGQAEQEANRIAHALIAADLHPGDRISLLLKNSVDAVLIYFAAFKAGIVATPMSHRLIPAEWARIADEAGSKLLICDAEFTADVDPLRGCLRSVRSFVTRNPEPPAGWESFDRWIADLPADTPEVEVGDQDDALQLTTSGTTRRPLSAVLTHGAITANLAQLGLVAPFRRGERFLIVLPLCHAAGVMAMLHAVSWGAALLIQRGFDPQDVVSALSEGSVAATMLVPTMIRRCLSEVANLDDRRFDDLRLMIYGASPMDRATVRQAMDAFPCDFAQRYGTTETLSLSWLGPEDHRRALDQRPELWNSAGRPLAGTRIRAVDKDGHALPPGAIGELVMRGPQRMRGYWNCRVATSDVVRSDWVHTGDAGFIDEEGYIHICDRVKDIIVSGGENVLPHEIEDVLMMHPDVAEAAVIGVPDTTWGEAVKGVVILREGARATAEQLIEFSRGKVAPFKLPRSIEFVERLPRNPVGKILRRELRERYWRGCDRRVS